MLAHQLSSLLLSEESFHQRKRKCTFTFTLILCKLTPENSYIASLDAKTGASLKLTILNATGRIWTLVAGGGASVVYADAIASAGFADELANYGEYSGAPTETQTYVFSFPLLFPRGVVLLLTILLDTIMLGLSLT